MRQIIQCLLSPRLYKIYREGSRESLYQPHILEKWSDKIISTAHTFLNISLYTSPLICIYIYKRGLYTLEESYGLMRFCGSLGCLLAFSILLRGLGRACNPKYVEFLNVYLMPNVNDTTYMEGIRKYDFDFSAWPVSYTVDSKKRTTWMDQYPFSSSANENLPLYQQLIIQVLAYVATHTFALRLIYPGSLGLIHNLLFSSLIQGRSQLVETFNGQRAKILTADGNFIDTMFVGNSLDTTKGRTLVICCEGNSGFYEIGIMTTPIKAGFSTLGWNHPGFAGSSGLPYPDQEQNAIDAVIQYAINELDYEPEHIILFGWSIGGYPATWAAVNYPNTKGLVLDATFDDLLPLAENHMPSSWSLLVKEVVRSYVDLNIAEMILEYPGPVQIVRRTEDEIICLRPGELSSNRGNHLLMKLIEARHPELTSDEMKAIRKYVLLLETQRTALERNDTNESIKKPLKLISKYMRDYKSSHCTPLPEDHFELVVQNMSSQM